MLLTGILCCYAMSYIILAPPQKWTCATLRIGIGLCLSICYSSIFIKTNRISRIFNQGVKSIQRPLYTSPVSQVAISSGKDNENLVSEIVNNHILWGSLLCLVLPQV
jgi:7 transmembrane sweet-taste receptor of 3 GCPR